MNKFEDDLFFTNFKRTVNDFIDAWEEATMSKTIQAVRCDVCATLHEEGDSDAYFTPTDGPYDTVCKDRSCVQKWAESVSGVSTPLIVNNTPVPDINSPYRIQSGETVNQIDESDTMVFQAC